MCSVLYRILNLFVAKYDKRPAFIFKITGLAGIRLGFETSAIFYKDNPTTFPVLPLNTGVSVSIYQLQVRTFSVSANKIAAARIDYYNVHNSRLIGSSQKFHSLYSSPAVISYSI